MTQRLCLPIVLLAVCLWGLGCGNSTKDIAGETPEATAKAFAAAMAKGDLKSAATAYAYVSEAKEKNENWAEIPQGQQNSIVRKLQEDKVKALEGMRGQFKGDVQVGKAQTQGGKAWLTITVGGQATNLQLVQDDGKWRISGSE